MSKTMSSGKHVDKSKINNKWSEWDLAIADAQARIKLLKASIRIWRDRRDTGEPWPESKKAGTDAKPIPA